MPGQKPNCLPTGREEKTYTYTMHTILACFRSCNLRLSRNKPIKHHVLEQCQEAPIRCSSSLSHLISRFKRIGSRLQLSHYLQKLQQRNTFALDRVDLPFDRQVRALLPSGSPANAAQPTQAKSIAWDCQRLECSESTA